MARTTYGGGSLAKQVEREGLWCKPVGTVSSTQPLRKALLEVGCVLKTCFFDFEIEQTPTKTRMRFTFYFS